MKQKVNARQKREAERQRSKVRNDDKWFFYRAMDLMLAIIAYSGWKDFEEYRASFCLGMRECRIRGKETGNQ